MKQTSYDVPKEASIVDSTRRNLQENFRGCKFMKTSGEGEPDLVGCINGKSVVIECKQPGKHPTILQYARLQEWAKAGALALWSDGQRHFRIDAEGVEHPVGDAFLKDAAWIDGTDD